METINVKKYERTNVSVDLTAVRHNLLQLKSNLPEGVKLMAVVKTDGYGHGAFAIAKYTQDIIDGYAVATAEEALSLRRHNIIDKMILILGVVTEAFYEELIKAEIRIPVFDIETVDKLNNIACRIGKKAVVHVKVDTGMSRIGIRSREEVIDFVEYINNLPGIYMEGIFTHFAKADNKDKSATKVQYDKFTALLSELEVKNINIPIRHCANSAATIDLPEYALDMVRAGIALYGLAPSGDVDITKLGIKPVMSWYSHVAYIKKLEAGCPISYDGTFVTEKDTVVATIPVGYGDGYPRAVSNKGYVLIRGKRAPILGRICMDQFMVDVTDIEGVSVKDEVVLIGSAGEECITVDDIADIAKSTFNYEIICNINKRVARLYYLDNELVHVAEYIDMLL